MKLMYRKKPIGELLIQEGSSILGYVHTSTNYDMSILHKMEESEKVQCKELNARGNYLHVHKISINEDYHEQGYLDKVVKCIELTATENKYDGVITLTNTDLFYFLRNMGYEEVLYIESNKYILAKKELK